MFKSREEMLTNPRPHKDLVEEFISSLDLSDNTVISYGGMLRRYAQYLEPNHIVKPNESDLVKYKKKIKKDGCRSATTQKYVIILRKFYKWCERRDYYPNISGDLTGENIVATFKREPLKIQEVQKLLALAKKRKDKNINCLRDYAIVSLIVKTGLRTIEVSRADVEDIVTLNGINYLFIQGKGHDDKDDQVKIPDSVYAIIQEYLEKRNSNAKALFITSGPRCNNERIKPYTISISIKHLLRAIGLDDKRYTAHSLRHTCATIALLSGAKYEEVQMVLRHKSIETTTIYAHNLSRETNNVELIVEKAIDELDEK